ncbi:hypothetical protein [Halomonas sp. BC04]|uniref:hypothetical protein n=1 Tax=Halomonas sp. BC04 TaxID=1403540 RepID=UPI0003ED64BA|nr:hypothetical protein [Halomonas sp. BC04]EWH02093.1 hypothetical protein Q427_10595 [Halomonas sp. BC04]
MPRPPHVWIDRQNPAQLAWIMDYLGRHQRDFTVPVDRHYLLDANALIAALDARMDNPLFRERYRKMQTAWRKQKSRQAPHRRTVTYQLHNEVLDLLDKLARKRGGTKVGVLEEIIQDAWYQHDRAAKQLKKTSASYKARLKDQRTKYQHAEWVYRDTIDALLEALADNMDQRCCLEAVIGEYDNAPLVGTDKAAYQSLLEARLSTLEAPLRDVKLLRLRKGSLAHRLSERAQARNIAAPHE